MLLVAVSDSTRRRRTNFSLASPEDVWRLTPDQIEAALTSPPRTASWISRVRATVATARTVPDVAIVTGRVATVVTLVARLHRVLRV